MINSTEQSRHTMNNYLTAVASDRRSFSTTDSVDRINDKMRLVQIEMIKGYQPNMNEAARKTALWVLKQIGG